MNNILSLINSRSDVIQLATNNNNPVYEEQLLEVEPPSLPSFSDMVNDTSRWEGCQIISKTRMQSLLSTALFIDVESTLYILNTSPIEIYCARLLKNRYHWRNTKIGNAAEMNFNISNSVSVNIPSDIPEFIDQLDNVHVVRPGSGTFERHAEKTNLDVLEVMKLCMTMGDQDSARRTADFHRVMNFGIKPELETKETTPDVYGSKYFVGMHKDEQLKVKSSIGSMIDFIWNVLQNIQSDLKKPSIGSDKSRSRKYGTPIREFFNAL